MSPPSGRTPKCVAIFHTLSHVLLTTPQKWSAIVLTMGNATVFQPKNISCGFWTRFLIHTIMYTQRSIILYLREKKLSWSWPFPSWVHNHRLITLLMQHLQTSFSSSTCILKPFHRVLSSYVMQYSYIYVHSWKVYMLLSNLMIVTCSLNIPIQTPPCFLCHLCNCVSYSNNNNNPLWNPSQLIWIISSPQFYVLCGDWHF